MSRKPTQNERIVEYINKFGSITQLEALKELGVMRLAARIWELRRQGYHITSSFEAVKNRFGQICYISRYKIKEREDVKP